PFRFVSSNSVMGDECWGMSAVPPFDTRTSTFVISCPPAPHRLTPHRPCVHPTIQKPNTQFKTPRRRTPPYFQTYHFPAEVESRPLLAYDSPAFDKGCNESRKHP